MAVVQTPLSLTWQWSRHHWVWHDSGLDTTESDMTVIWTPLSLTSQRSGHRWVWNDSGLDTVKSDMTVVWTPLSLTWQWSRNRWVGHDSGPDTTESNMRLCKTLLSLQGQCTAGSMHYAVNHWFRFCCVKYSLGEFKLLSINNFKNWLALIIFSFIKCTLHSFQNYKLLLRHKILIFAAMLKHFRWASNFFVFFSRNEWMPEATSIIP